MMLPIQTNPKNSTMIHYNTEMYFNVEMGKDLFELCIRPNSVSCQLIRRKVTQFFHQLNYLIKGTVALTQWVDNIEQCSYV